MYIYIVPYISKRFLVKSITKSLLKYVIQNMVSIIEQDYHRHYTTSKESTLKLAEQA